MNKIYEPVELEQAAALRWLRHSLGQGEALSLATPEIIERCDGRSYAILPGGLEPKLNLDFNGILGLDGGPANRAMARVLKEVGLQGAACVVVEDDLREKGGANPDRKGSLLTAFVGQRVIHWANLGADADIDAAVTALKLGASGYPLNAFVTSTSEAELGLFGGTDVSSDIVSVIIGSLKAVIVGAYDGVSLSSGNPARRARWSSEATRINVYGQPEMIFEQINNTTGAVGYLYHDQQGSTRLLTGSTGKIERPSPTTPTATRPATPAPRPPRSVTTPNTPAQIQDSSI